MYRDKRTSDDPLVVLQMFNAETDPRHMRRELTEEEMTYLLSFVEGHTLRTHNLAGPERAIVYRIALGTGFRAKDEARRKERERTDSLAYEDSSGRFCDFHAMRHTYISTIVAGGASVKTAQELARHSSPQLTIGRYSHTRLHDLTGALEALQPVSKPDSPHEAVSAKATGTVGSCQQNASSTAASGERWG